MPPQQTYRVRSTLLVGLTVWCLLVSSPTANPAKIDNSLSSLLAGYKFRTIHLEEEGGGGLSFRIAINGKSGALIIATSAPITVLDRNSLYRFGISEKRTAVPLHGTFGDAQDYVGVGNVKSLEVAKIVLADFAAGIIDESSLNRVPHHKLHLDGVFGFSHIQKLGGIIDCSHRMLYLNPWGARRDASSKLAQFLGGSGYVRVPMHFNLAGHPEIDCRINGRAAKMSVETASIATTIGRRLSSDAHLLLTAPNINLESVGYRTASASAATTKEFCVGQFCVGGGKIEVADAAFNVLGIDYLSSNHAIIDSGSMTLFLHR